MLVRRYSNIVELIDIGRSYEGRHLLVIKVCPSVCLCRYAVAYLRRDSLCLFFSKVKNDIIKIENVENIKNGKKFKT